MCNVDDPNIGLDLLEKPGLEQQLPSNDRHTAVVVVVLFFTISMGLVQCVRDESNVPRSKIPCQTRGSICSEQGRERKYEHHAVYPGIARRMYNASAK